MPHGRVIEGTTEEIAALLRDGAFAGRKLRVIVDPEEDFSDELRAPPGPVRDRAHLEGLLIEGIASAKEEVTDQEWIALRREVRERLAEGNR